MKPTAVITRNDAAAGFQITRASTQGKRKPHFNPIRSAPIRPKSPTLSRRTTTTSLLSSPSRSPPQFLRATQRPCPGRARERGRAQICAVSPAMACIKSAQRAALTALAPDAPYLAAGTMSGAVDMSFSASANIEIFRLDFQSDSPDLPLLASAPSPDRFNRLSWSRPGAVEGDSFALGLLAGGLSDGSVAVWNPLSMIRSGSASLARFTLEICSRSD